MPGLLRGVARTAVVAGTASAVSGRVQRRQAQRWGEEDARYGSQQPSAPPPARESAPDRIAQLKELGELKASGVLSEEEFAQEKQRLLA